MLYLRALCGCNKIGDVSIDVHFAGREWKWHPMPATAPKAAAYAQVRASVHENSKAWLDDFRLVRSSPADPGRSCGPDYLWR
jgi:hypothetical protein